VLGLARSGRLRPQAREQVAERGHLEPTSCGRADSTETARGTRSPRRAVSQSLCMNSQDSARLALDWSRLGAEAGRRLDGVGSGHVVEPAHGEVAEPLWHGIRERAVLGLERREVVGIEVVSVRCRNVLRSSGPSVASGAWASANRSSRYGAGCVGVVRPRRIGSGRVARQRRRICPSTIALRSAGVASHDSEPVSRLARHATEIHDRLVIRAARSGPNDTRGTRWGCRCEGAGCSSSRS
jgi:hypothetical protein